MRFYRRSHVLALLATLVLLTELVNVNPVRASGYAYAGYNSTGTYLGIDGYLRQSGSVALVAPQHHGVWINICDATCAHWVQTGTYQGFGPTNRSSPSQTSIFHESMDQCFRHVILDDLPPPQPDYAYYLSYDGTGAHVQTCADGSHPNFYVWEFRKGSVGSLPFAYGQLPVLSGRAFARTEIFPDQSVPIGTDRFGCDTNQVCGNPSFGIHLLAGGWTLWTSDATPRSDNKPWLGPIQPYWGFKTCSTSC